jgi:intracellular multiplication protein IcmD
MKSLLKNAVATVALGVLYTPVVLAQGTGNFSGSGQTLGGMSSNVTGSLENVSNLGSAVAFVAGIFFAVIGLFKFKAYKENPQQTPLGQPIMMIVLAAALLALPTVIGSGMKTLWSDGASETTVQGWGTTTN